MIMGRLLELDKEPGMRPVGIALHFFLSCYCIIDNSHFVHQAPLPLCFRSAGGDPLEDCTVGEDGAVETN